MKPKDPVFLPTLVETHSKNGSHRPLSPPCGCHATTVHIETYQKAKSSYRHSSHPSLTSPSIFCVMTRSWGNARARAAMASWPALGVFRVKLTGKCLRKNSLYQRSGSRRNTERLPCAAAVTHHTESLPPRKVGIPGVVRRKHSKGYQETN